MQHQLFSHSAVLLLITLLASCGGGESSEEVDSIPDTITFTHQSNVDPSDLVELGPVVLTGFNTPLTVTRGTTNSYSTVNSQLTNELVSGRAYYTFTVDGVTMYDDAFEVNAGQSLGITLYPQQANDIVTEGTFFIGDVEVPFSVETASFDGSSMLISHGDQIRLYRYSDDDGFRYTDSASISMSADDSNVAIHKMITAPEGDRVYTLNSNKCNLDTSGECLGNSTIQLFSYDGNFVSYEGIVFDANPRIAVKSTSTSYGLILITFTNNFPVNLKIDTTYIYSRRAELPGVSSCTETTLLPGEDCTVALDVSETPEFPGGRVEIATSEGTFSTVITGSDFDYQTTGVYTNDNIPGSPACQYDIGFLPDQSGACHFRDLVFSADGDYAFATEAKNNSIVSFEVSENGALVFLSELFKTGDNRPSLAINKNNDILYSGDSAYTIDDGLLSLIHTGQHSYDTELTSEGRLITTMDFNGVSIFDVNADPTSPAFIGASESSESNLHLQLTTNDELFYSTGIAGQGLEVREYRFPSVAVPEGTFVEPEQVWSVDMLNGCSECNNTIQVSTGITVDESKSSLFLAGRIDNIYGSETGIVNINGRLIRIDLTGNEENVLVELAEPVTDIILIR